MKKLLIYNNEISHYEIIESVILKYNEILNIPKDDNLTIYLHATNDDLLKEHPTRIFEVQSFENYITTKYPKIIFGKITDYDYFINCTIYDRHYDSLNKNIDSNHKYIAHEITERLKLNPNVYYLTPLSKQNYLNANILPFTDKKVKSNIPIYVIQGSLKRRDTSLLESILKTNYFYNFKIKLLNRIGLPENLKKYESKFIIKKELHFTDYHREFADVYSILPLVSKNKNLFCYRYYIDKLTSTINYASGYKLKCLIDKELQNIYNLKNVVIYNDINDISSKFNKTLKEFYNNPLLDKKVILKKKQCKITVKKEKNAKKIQGFNKKIKECNKKIQGCNKKILKDNKKNEKCNKKIYECNKKIHEYNTIIQKYNTIIQECNTIIQECNKKIKNINKKIREKNKNTRI
jgi:hypothetical protein